MDVPNYVELESPAAPELAGKVTFSLPTVYQQLQIDGRMAALAGPAGFEALPTAAQQRVMMVATLEFVIQSAPRGFYVEHPRTGHPLLSFEAISALDMDVLWDIYAAYIAYRNAFRENRVRRDPQTPAREARVAGGESGE